MKTILNFIQTGLNKMCEGVAYLLILIFSLITYEVIARYFFNSPTSWAWVITQQLFLVICLFGGVYSFIKQSHIRIEMLYDRFPASLKMVSRLCSLVMFVIFAGAFLWKSSHMAQASIAGREIARGAFPLPLYPFKALMPVVGFLFLIQGIISISRDK